MLGQFRQSCSKKYLDEITKQDLADFVVFMKERNLSDYTIANRVEEVVTLLRDPDETRGKDSHASRKVRGKENSQLQAARDEALFAAADQEQDETFKFFLGTGGRDQEDLNGH